MLGLQRANVPG